jgi:hypothetical protein
MKKEPLFWWTFLKQMDVNSEISSLFTVERSLEWKNVDIERTASKLILHKRTIWNINLIIKPFRKWPFSHTVTRCMS